MEQPTRSPEREQLLAVVDEIAPTLRDNAQLGEQERRLPQPSVEALRDANLFRCPSPKAVGGLEVDPLTQVEVFEAVAAIDGAAGWNLMIGALSAAMIATRIGDSAIGQVFGASRWPIVAGLVWPRGRAVPTDGGYRVSGRWSFGSGIHQADWVMGGSFVIEGGKPRANPDGSPRLHMVVMPRDRATLHDNWHVAGLRGTGSCDYSVEDVDVPDEFVYGTPSSPRRGGPWAGLPGMFVVGTGHAGFALGIAKGVLRELEQTVAASSRSMTQSSIGDRESFQLALGRHTIAYDAARTLALDAHRDVWETACHGEEPSQGQVSRMRISGVYATEVAVEIAQFAYRAAGTAGLYESSPIQRALRDVLAGQQHIYYRDTAYADVAKARIAAASTPPEAPAAAG